MIHLNFLKLYIVNFIKYRTIRFTLKWCSLLVLFFSVSMFTAAQDKGQTVKGIVVDGFSGSPLPGARVYIVGSNPVVLTVADENGEFKFKKIMPGRWSFSCSFLGYNSQLINNVMVLSGKESAISIKLLEKVNL